MRTRTDYIAIHRAETDFDSYHVVVHRDGNVDWRMEPDAHGAAVRNFNSVTLSVAVEGDFCSADAAKAIHGTPTPEQWKAAVGLVTDLCVRYPGAKIVAHTELGPGSTFYVEKLSVPLSCPGTRFDMDAFRRDVSNRLAQLRQPQAQAAALPAPATPPLPSA